MDLNKMQRVANFWRKPVQQNCKPVARPAQDLRNADRAQTLTLFFLAPHGLEVVDKNRCTLDEIVHPLLEMWNEETGPQTFFVRNEDGVVLSTVMRTGSNHELAMVMDADGGYGLYRCHYVLDDAGKYLRTEISTIVL